MIVEDGTGLPNADSYLSVAEAISILADLVPSSTFPSQDQSTQESLLKAASLQFDAFYIYGGTIFSTLQSMKCPRQDLYDEDGRLQQGVPRLLKYAVAVQSDYLSDNDWRDDLSTDIKKATLGPLSLELSGVGATNARNKSPITLAASQFMRGIAVSRIKSGRRGSTRLVSV